MTGKIQKPEDLPDDDTRRNHPRFGKPLRASQHAKYFCRQPFSEPAPGVEEVAVMAAGLHAMLAPANLAAGGAAIPTERGAMRWKDQARLAALSGLAVRD